MISGVRQFTHQPQRQQVTNSVSFVSVVMIRLTIAIAIRLTIAQLMPSNFFERIL